MAAASAPRGEASPTWRRDAGCWAVVTGAVVGVIRLFAQRLAAGPGQAGLVASSLAVRAVRAPVTVCGPAPGASVRVAQDDLAELLAPAQALERLAGSRPGRTPRRPAPAGPGRRAAVTSSNSGYEPMVEPMISICLKNRRGRFSSTFGPDVPPHTTSRPPGRSALTDRSHVAGPTLSTTTSTLTGQSASESKASAAPASTRPLPAWPRRGTWRRRPRPSAGPGPARRR